MPANKTNTPVEYAAPGLVKPRDDLSRAVMWLFCIFILLIPAAEGILVSVMPDSAQLTHDRSRFAVINALTLTGFQTGISINTYPPAGQVLILVLTLIGTLFTLTVGGLAAVRILRLPYSDRQIIRSSFITTAGFVILGAIPLIEQTRSPLHAFMLSASAFGNSGLFFGPLPPVLSWATSLLLLPLAVLGSLGLPVLMDLYDALLRRRALCFHSLTVLQWTGGLYLAFFALILLTRWLSLNEFPTLAALPALIGSSSVASINSRSAGFPFQYAQDFPRMTQWLLILSMAIGGSPAGTAGGMKTTTLATLWRGTRRTLRGENPGRPFGIAIAWFALYATAVGFFLLLLLGTDPQLRFDRLLLEIVSAVSNIGISSDQVILVTPGLDILAAAMLFGRLAPLLTLWWMARTTEGAELAVG